MPRHLPDRESLEILLVTHPANMNYITGYDGWSLYVHQAALVAIDQSEPIWFGREQDSNGARMITWLKPDYIHGYATLCTVQLKASKGFCSRSHQRVWMGRNLGVEMDGFFYWDVL